MSLEVQAELQYKNIDYIEIIHYKPAKGNKVSNFTFLNR
jgi:hypothetical protein